MFFEKLVDKKNEKVKIDIIPKTNEEYLSVTYGFIRFIASYRFLSMSLDGLIKILNEEVFKIKKKDSPDKWQHLNTKIGHPCEHFNSINDFEINLLII